MKKVLVIFSGTRDNIEIIDRILEIEGKNIFLKVVFILSDAIPSNFSTWLMYIGFLGEEPTKEIKELIIKEIENLLFEKRDLLEKGLKKKKVNFNIEFLKGDFSFLLKEKLREEKWNSVYTPKAREVVIGEESVENFDIREI